MKNRPPYALESVDNALRLLQLLRDQGTLRVSEAAAELGIARSTAHRLLAMLVYRDFAVRGDDHAYLPGPALSAPPLHGEPVRRLREAIRPHADALRDRTSESVSLLVLHGRSVRFLYTAESTRPLRVGDRQGTVLPAWRTSGGKALLAELALLPDVPRSSLRGIAEARRLGYGENIEETESGVCAVGMCVGGGAALSISVPSVRYAPAPLVRELRKTVNAITLP
jgi:IclR family acetate operon transcriptional repressor